jgi:hypothetical protein
VTLIGSLTHANMAAAKAQRGADGSLLVLEAAAGHVDMQSSRADLLGGGGDETEPDLPHVARHKRAGRLREDLSVEQAGPKGRHRGGVRHLESDRFQLHSHRCTIRRTRGLGTGKLGLTRTNVRVDLGWRNYGFVNVSRAWVVELVTVDRADGAEHTMRLRGSGRTLRGGRFGRCVALAGVVMALASFAGQSAAGANPAKVKAGAIIWRHGGPQICTCALPSVTIDGSTHHVQVVVAPATSGPDLAPITVVSYGTAGRKLWSSSAPSSTAGQTPVASKADPINHEIYVLARTADSSGAVLDAWSGSGIFLWSKLIAANWSAMNSGGGPVALDADPSNGTVYALGLDPNAATAELVATSLDGDVVESRGRRQLQCPHCQR